jgi:hypothetical protein
MEFSAAVGKTGAIPDSGNRGTLARTNETA